MLGPSGFQTQVLRGFIFPMRITRARGCLCGSQRLLPLCDHVSLPLANTLLGLFCSEPYLCPSYSPGLFSTFIGGESVLPLFGLLFSFTLMWCYLLVSVDPLSLGSPTLSSF